MSQIVRALEGDASLDDLHQDGVKPGQSMLFSTGDGGGSQNMSRFRQLAFDSGDYDDYSSDYSTDSCTARPPRRLASRRLGEEQRTSQWPSLARQASTVRRPASPSSRSFLVAASPRPPSCSAMPAGWLGRARRCFCAHGLHSTELIADVLYVRLE